MSFDGRDELIKTDGIGRMTIERRIAALVHLLDRALELCPSLQREIDEGARRHLEGEKRR